MRQIIAVAEAGEVVAVAPFDAVGAEHQVDYTHTLFHYTKPDIANVSNGGLADSTDGCAYYSNAGKCMAVIRFITAI